MEPLYKTEHELKPLKVLNTPHILCEFDQNETKISPIKRLKKNLQEAFATAVVNCHYFSTL